MRTIIRNSIVCIAAMAATSASAQSWWPLFNEDFESLLSDADKKVNVEGLVQITSSASVTVTKETDCDNHFVNLHLHNGDNNRSWDYKFDRIEGAAEALAYDGDYKFEFDLAMQSGGNANDLSTIAVLCDGDNNTLLSVDYHGMRALVEGIHAPNLGADEDITPSEAKMPVVPYISQSRSIVQYSESEKLWANTTIPTHFVHFVITASKENNEVRLRAEERVGEYTALDIRNGYIMGSYLAKVSEGNKVVYTFMDENGDDVTELKISNYCHVTGLAFYLGRTYSSVSIDNVVLSIPVGESINGVSIENEMDDVVIYDIMGRRQERLSKGVNIVNGKKVLVK